MDVSENHGTPKSSILIGFSIINHPFWGTTIFGNTHINQPCFCGGGDVVFLLKVQYSILKSLISTCVLSYVGSREDWLLDRICESKKDCWDSIRRTSYPYQEVER